MSMGLYSQRGVYIESWVEMTPDVEMRYEVDRANDKATLFIGTGNVYVLNIYQDNIDQLLDLCAAAKRELARPRAEDD